MAFYESVRPLFGYSKDQLHYPKTPFSEVPHVDKQKEEALHDALQRDLQPGQYAAVRRERIDGVIQYNVVVGNKRAIEARLLIPGSGRKTISVNDLANLRNVLKPA